MKPKWAPTRHQWRSPASTFGKEVFTQRPYRAMFESVWGQPAFAIDWPSEVEQVCAWPGPPPTGDLLPVHLVGQK
jgi:hypothetical protein